MVSHQVILPSVFSAVQSDVPANKVLYSAYCIAAWRITIVITILFAVLSTSVVQAQSLSTLYSFSGTEPNHPKHGVVNIGSTLYGTASYPGNGTSWGRVFSIDMDGNNFNILHDFTMGENGASPNALTVYNSTLYTTSSSSIFKINPDGSDFTVLHTFGSGSDGATPHGALTQVGSTFYGMCETGGTNGTGTLYKINADGTGYSTIYSYPTGAYNTGMAHTGCTPTVIGSTLYAMSYLGGRHSKGNIFSINLDGSGYQNLYDFTGGTDGQQPYGTLATDGTTLYGINSYRDSPLSGGVLFRVGIDGTGFTVLHANYGSSQIAQSPTLIGSTLYCPSDYDIYQIDTDGTDYRDLYSFGSGDSMIYTSTLLPIGSMFYGTTAHGENNAGTVFALNTVPEPASAALLGIGVFCVAAYIWRQRKAAT
jgi:uncharacterized repeat protein (TIGR03803 family)